LDADVVAPAEQVRKAIARAQATGRVVLGFKHYLGLTPRMTERVLGGYTGDAEAPGGVRYRSDTHESSIVVVPRAVWDAVGGFDERFVGWGQEDVAFIHAARLLTGEVERVGGTVWHLWHGRAPGRNRLLPSYKAAQQLGRRYRTCTTADEMRALLAEPPEESILRQPDPVSINRAAAFSRIYRSNAWNGVETRSGPGSGTVATATLQDWLPKVCAELGISSVLDAGCGEGTWQPDLPGYIGIDIAREALAVARRVHPERTYGVADICRDTLPTTDAVLCRDALQHLPLADGLAAIENFRRAGARYLIASSHQDGVNRDVAPGAWYTCNLSAPPFSFAEPVATIFDGQWEGYIHHPEKSLGVWAL
jgi:hypothetical protein